MRREPVPVGYCRSLRAAIWLCFAGLKDAVSLHRCFVFSVHDPAILTKLAQCFLLNGVIFLGSNLLIQFAVQPGIRWLLHVSLQTWAPAVVLQAVDSLILNVYVWLWLAPAYLISVLVNTIWYQDIATRAFAVLQKQASSNAQQSATNNLRYKPQPLNQFIASQVYAVLLITVFMVQVSAVQYVPYIGHLLQGVLRSWQYAFYWFDYKWNLTGMPLGSRVRFFQSHWAYFAGFGSVATVPWLLFSFFHSEALMAMAFPLFALTACVSDPLAHYNQVANAEAARGQQLDLRSVPIFFVAQKVTTYLVRRSDKVTASLVAVIKWIQ